MNENKFKDLCPEFFEFQESEIRNKDGHLLGWSCSIVDSNKRALGGGTHVMVSSNSIIAIVS